MALVATLVIVAVILALAAAGLLLARTALVLYMNFRDAAAAYYRGRAGIERATADLAAGYAYDGALTGPDGAPGTADDGQPPPAAAVAGTVVRFEDDPADPDADPGGDGNDRIRVVVEATGPRGALRRLEAIVGRHPTPYAPAAAYLGRPDTLSTATIRFDGADHEPTDAFGAGSGPGAGVAPAASPALDEPRALPGDVADGRGVAIVATPAAPIDAPGLRARLTVAGIPLTAMPEGVFGPALVRTPGGAVVGTATAGEGVLVVEGDLDVQADFAFTGTLIVLGQLRVAAGGAMSIRGWLWVAGGPGGPVVIADGPLTVAYSSRALAAADALFRLPRRPLRLAERELP